MSTRPKIGITMRTDLETRRFYLGRDYSEAVAAAGADPVHIPLVPDASYINSIVGSLDGILLPGSDTDVDPDYYGEQPHRKLKKVLPEKDLTDRMVLERAEALHLPLLAICYGMQALNVFRGGSLVQDIDSQIDGAIQHEQGVPLERSSHSIAFNEEWPVNITGDRTARVNSHHHQAIGRLGTGLTATAFAPDGVVEAIQDMRAGRFMLGVQWHPELSWKTDELSSAIFETFVVQCSALANRDP